MTASAISFRIAVAFAILGIASGIAMAVSGQHAVYPAHAHLSLLGWVSLFLFGLYYKQQPTINASRVARIQVLGWSLGSLALASGVALIYLGYPIGESIAKAGAIVVLVNFLLFSLLVFRTPSHQ